VRRLRPPIRHERDRGVYEVVLATLAELSDEARAEVLAGTARRFYRLAAQPAVSD
jgi:predicted TIM-barrel fold metal-dependent hydrolase